MATSLLDDLNRHYETNGISATNFHCRHRYNCSNDSDTFTEAKEAFVGTEYEPGSIPRILFVSLDPGGDPGRGATDSAKRTVEGVRHWEEHECDLSKCHKGRHWYLTHEMAWFILKQFRSDLDIQDIKPYFAHTNSAKCCQNKESRKKADRHLFANCRAYLFGEVAALRPDIIISQGAEARAAIDAFIPPVIVIERVDTDDCPYSILEISGKRTLWLHTYHPANYKNFYSQKERCWSSWAQLARKVINQNGHGR
jgi:uracil-DNA glycosylase